MMKRKGILVAALCAIAACLPLSGAAFAGRTGNAVASDASFSGTELSFADWRYDRGAGIGFRETMRCYQFDRLHGDDTGIKAKNAIPAGHGSAVDLEFVRLDIETGGWPGLSYGSQSGEKSNGAFWDCYRAGSGKLHYYSQSGGKIGLTFNMVGKNGNGETDYVGDPSVQVSKFEDGSGKGFSESEGYVLDCGPVLVNTTLREYYGADGGYELSVREIGAPVSERTVLIRTRAGQSIDPNPGGYVGLTFMTLRTPMTLTDFAVYACDDPDEENASLQKVCGFVKEGEADTLSQFTLGNEGSVTNLKAGAVNSIAFDKMSDVGNPLLNRTRISASEEVPLALSGNFVLKLNELVGNKRFGAVFGVPALSADVGEPGTSYLYFEKTGNGYGCGLIRYGEEETELLPLTALPAGVSAEAIDISVKLYSDGRLDFRLNGNAFYEGEAGEIEVEGYFGFAQSGAFTGNTDYVDAEILSMNLLNQFYAKPAAPDSFADFNDNTVNLKEWYLKYGAFLGSGIAVQEGALVFDGAGQNSGITSRYSYSNFECRFDFSGAQNTPVLDGGGNVISGASYWIAVTFGAETESAESAGVSSGQALGNGSFLYFSAETDQTTGKRAGETAVAFVHKGVYQTLPGQDSVNIPLPKKYAFFDEGFDTKTVVTVRVTVLDGVMRVGVKLKSESEFYELCYFNYPEGYTPNGHVSIFAEGNNNIPTRKIDIGSSYRIDNLGLYNWDENGNYVDPGYQSNVPEFAEDYDYVDTWTETEQKESGKSGCAGQGVSAGIAFAGILAAAVLKRGIGR